MTRLTRHTAAAVARSFMENFFPRQPSHSASIATSRPYFLPILEAVGHSLRWRVNLHGSPRERMFFDPEGVSRAGKLAVAQRQLDFTWTVDASRKSQPHVMRRLRSDPVELQSGKKADDTARHTCGRFHQRLVLVTVVIRRSVKPTTKSPNFLLVHQPTQILAGVASRDHISRTKYPQPAGVVARDLETSPIVTFCFHLFTHGMIT